MTAKKAAVLRQTVTPFRTIVLAVGDAADITALVTKFNTYQGSSSITFPDMLDPADVVCEAVALMHPVVPGDTLVLETGLYKKSTP